jgi:hypothetical protein
METLEPLLLEYWSTGVLEYWSIGVLECWSVGKRHAALVITPIRRPVLALLRRSVTTADTRNRKVDINRRHTREVTLFWFIEPKSFINAYIFVAIWFGEG